MSFPWLPKSYFLHFSARCGQAVASHSGSLPGGDLLDVSNTAPWIETNLKIEPDRLRYFHPYFQQIPVAFFFKMCLVFLGGWWVLYEMYQMYYLIYLSTNFSNIVAFAVCLCVILPCWWSRIHHGFNESRTPAIK